MWKEILELLEAAGRLKRIKRTGWVEAGISEPESVAEHSFRTALIAMILADLQGLDTEKAIKMALIHDLAESEVGDLTPEEKGKRGWAYKLKEEEAMKRLLSHLPDPLSENYRSIWKELKCITSPEAEIVNQSDKLEMCIQAVEYMRAGFNSSKLEKFLKIEMKSQIKELYNEVIKRRKNN